MPPGASESSGPLAASVAPRSPGLASTIDQVLAPAFLGHLGRMRLAVRRAFGARPGETPVRGQVQASGLELERHKAYDQGDELRFLDWNAYARLDQLLVRQFRAEREAPVHVFIDGSASMTLPEEDGKFAFAVGAALALAYVAIRHHNPVRVVLLRQGGDDFVASPAVRFPASLQRLASFCSELSAGGATVLARGIESYLPTQQAPAMALVISDFLVEPAVWRSTLHQLSRRGYEVAALRPLGPAERDPSRSFQRARLHDIETGSEKIVRLTPANLALYQQALTESLHEMERSCLESEALFATCDIGAGLEHCLFTQLPQIGLLR